MSKNIEAYAGFKVGKKRYFKIDIIEAISVALKISKSEVRRLIEQGAVSMWTDVKEKK